MSWSVVALLVIGVLVLAGLLGLLATLWGNIQIVNFVERDIQAARRDIEQLSARIADVEDRMRSAERYQKELLDHVIDLKCALGYRFDLDTGYSLTNLAGVRNSAE